MIKIKFDIVGIKEIVTDNKDLFKNEKELYKSLLTDNLKSCNLSLKNELIIKDKLQNFINNNILFNEIIINEKENKAVCYYNNGFITIIF